QADFSVRVRPQGWRRRSPRSPSRAQAGTGVSDVWSILSGDHTGSGRRTNALDRRRPSTELASTEPGERRGRAGARYPPRDGSGDHRRHLHRLAGDRHEGCDQRGGRDELVLRPADGGCRPGGMGWRGIPRAVLARGVRGLSGGISAVVMAAVLNQVIFVNGESAPDAAQFLQALYIVTAVATVLLVASRRASRDRLADALDEVSTLAEEIEGRDARLQLMLSASGTGFWEWD